MLCYATVCHGMGWYGMRCCAMLWYAMICNTLSLRRMPAQYCGEFLSFGSLPPLTHCVATAGHVPPVIVCDHFLICAKRTSLRYAIVC